MVSIAVAGEAARWIPAERGTVRVSVMFESNDRTEAFGSASTTHTALCAQAETLVADGFATWWQSDRVWVSTVQRYVKDSDTTVPVEVASVSLSVTFADFARLGDWLGEIGTLDGVTVDGISWALTQATLTAALAEMRVGAVHDARTRAAAYAEAIGESGLVLDRVYEPGLRPGSSPSDHGMISSSMKLASNRSGGDYSFEMKPSDIEVAASITADFRTGSTPTTQ